MKNFVFLFFVFCSLIGFAQADKHKVVHISGAVVEGDSLKALPFAHLTIKGNNIGTVTDAYGFFSLIAHTGDTIEFSSIGFHKNQFIVPTQIQENSYSLIHVMLKDTILLKEFSLFPWPTIEEFSTAFINLELSKDDQQRAEENLNKHKLMAAAGSVPLEGSTTYKYELQNRYTRMYLADGFPSLRLLDPIAWSKFINAWKNGDFKKKDNIKYLPK